MTRKNPSRAGATAEPSIHTATEDVICPQCGAGFKVSKHRLMTAKTQPCCSRSCGVLFRTHAAATANVPWKTSRLLQEFDESVSSLPIGLVRSWWEQERADGHEPSQVLIRLNNALGSKYGTGHPQLWAARSNFPLPVRRYMMTLILNRTLPAAFFSESLVEGLL